MEEAQYIKQLKRLIKKYHPDLCNNQNMGKIYNEITVKLNSILDELKKRENYSMAEKKEQDYLYYKLGIKYYKNIHPDRFYKRNVNKTYETKNYEEQLTELNKIYMSFKLSEYYFYKIIFEYNHSQWIDDSRGKVKLLKKLYKSYENMDIENNNQIINTENYLKEMGLKPLF
jgi:hypothetical protein